MNKNLAYTNIINFKITVKKNEGVTNSRVFSSNENTFEYFINIYRYIRKIYIYIFF